MNNLVGKKSIFYFPEDFISYVDEKDGVISFSKFEAFFDAIEDQEVFSVRVDDFLWIGKDFKLTDDENKKAFFGKVAKDSKGGRKEHKSIHGRVAAVYVAICEGNIKLGNINKVED